MQNDDYMPMTVNNLAEYDEIMDIVWYKEERDRLAITYVSIDSKKLNPIWPLAVRFPTALPFSQMYHYCCIEIRSFLNKYFFFSKEYFQQHGAINETLRKVGT